MSLRQGVSVSNILGSLGDFVRGLRLSPIEMVALTVALLYVAFIAGFHFTKVQPRSAEITTLQDRENLLKTQIQKSNTDEEKRRKQAANAEGILNSLAGFNRFLKEDERGMTQIINDIDGLGKTNKVIIGDASYRVEESEQTDETAQKQAGNNEKKQKIYPSLGIDTVVIGEYSNLRRFLAGLERSTQFLVINGMTFQGESDQVRRAANKAGGRNKLELSSAEAIPVSLKIELDTYFQPPPPDKSVQQPPTKK